MSKTTVLRKCAYDRCSYVFESTNTNNYEPCPKCNSATIPINLEDTINKKIKKTSSPIKKAQLQTSFYRFFKCHFGYECYLVGVYSPVCEEKLLRIECLAHIHLNQQILDYKMDEILDLLHQIAQSLQHEPKE